MLPKADLRSLEWILRRVEKLSPESRRWLIARMSADYINGKHQPLIDGRDDAPDRCEHSIPACRFCRPHPWRPWSDPKAWKPEPFPDACGDCAKPKAEHNDGEVAL